MLFGKPLKTMSAREVKTGIEEDQILLVDVREKHENDAACIDCAKLMPLSEFDPKKLPNPEGKTIVLHCQGGVRSAQALKKCVDAGIDNIAHMGGGMMAWMQEGYPTKK